MEFVAWLDDDEEASPDWLASLIAVRRETGAQSVFGPVHARADHDADNAEFYERLYTRDGPANDTVISHAHGIGNSLQPRSMFEEVNRSTLAPTNAAAKTIHCSRHGQKRAQPSLGRQTLGHRTSRR
ncbi:MAG: glycosyltransferase [Caulobacteraceae bacterium]|nr:glycosyltransferase [Caulobacteraceae bacterium]